MKKTFNYLLLAIALWAYPLRGADISEIYVKGTAVRQRTENEVDIASAATTTLAGVTSENLRITGTTGINSFGAASAGTYKKGRFQGVVLLTHSANLILNAGGAAVTTAANDRFEAFCLSSGIWLVNIYRNDGTALVGAGSISGLTSGKMPVATGSTTIADGPISVATVTNLSGAVVMTIHRLNATNDVQVNGVSLSKTNDNLGLHGSSSSAALAAVVSDETGTGVLVYNTSPTLVTPVLGVATATSINGSTVPSSETLVGRSTTDTLASKTLTTPTIASFVNATHTHQNAAGGGTLQPSTALSATGTASSSTYLRGDNSWSTPSGTGDFSGPASSTNNNIILFSGTGGKTGKDSKIATDGNGAITTASTVTAAGFTSSGTAAGGFALGDGSTHHFSYTNGTMTADVEYYPPTAPGSGVVLWTAGTAPRVDGTIVATTGSGNFVRATSPTLVTPTLGAASATTINGTTIPASVTLTKTTDNLSVFAATTSAQLLALITNPTGSGSAVFATSPTLVTPVLGVATATSIDVGNADTTVARSAAGIISVEGVDVPTVSSTHTLTGKTFNTQSAGNVLQMLDYKDFVYPHRVDGTGATIVTNSYTSALSGLTTHAGTGGTNANFAFYRIGTVPLDLDTGTTMKLRNLAFRVSGTDTGSASFSVGYFSPASSSAYSPSDFTALSGYVLFTSGTLTTPAADDIFYMADVTLTGWAGGLTAGRPLLIGIARDGADANNDSITIVGGTIEYGRIQ